VEQLEQVIGPSSLGRTPALNVWAESELCDEVETVAEFVKPGDMLMSDGEFVIKCRLESKKSGFWEVSIKSDEYVGT
jgi:hypothetical protein